MQKIIRLNDQDINYDLKISPRARHLRLAVYGNCLIVVTRPRGLKENEVEFFLRAKSAWLLSKLQYFKKHEITQPQISPLEYRQKKNSALNLIRQLLAEYNQHYNFKISSIKVKNQKTRWGSCSRQGNLNFSYRLFFLPEELTRYIVVHELCHLRELNHGTGFWQLVAQTIPDYQEKRKKLRAIALGV